MLMKTALRLFLVMLTAFTLSCSGMLDDMAQSFSSLDKQLNLGLLLQFKPLPEMSLQAGELLVNSGDLFDMGWVYQDAEKITTLTVTNIGPSSTRVPIMGITLSGKYADRFAVSNINPPISDPDAGIYLESGQTATFDVSFKSAKENDGYRAALLTIDTGEDYAPFKVTVGCERREILQARMDVWCGTTLIPSGATYPMGTTTTTKSALFSIYNTGTADLTITGVSLSDAFNFELKSLPDVPFSVSPVKDSNSVLMMVYFTPTSLGGHSAWITFTCNDGVNTGVQYTMRVTGTAEAVPTREINLFEGITPLVNNDPMFHAFGDILVNEQSAGKSFRIHNSGTVPLTVSAIVLSDMDDPDNPVIPSVNFTYLGPENITLFPDESTPFTVFFNPKSGTGHTARMVITSDDDEDADTTWVIKFSGNTLYDYTVTYLGNFNSSGTPPQDYAHYLPGDPVTVLSQGTLEKTGCTFGGWCDTAACTGNVYFDTPPNNTFDMGSANATLWAKWDPILKVTYDSNGGTGDVPVDPNSYQLGDKVTVLAKPVNLTLSGYDFEGWYQSGSGTVYSAGDFFYMADTDVTLLAKWKLRNTVTYDANGGTGDVPVDANTYKQGDPVTVLAKPSNLNYYGFEFEGWCQNGSSTVYTEGDSITMGSASITLHAKWNAVPIMEISRGGSVVTSGGNFAYGTWGADGDGFHTSGYTYYTITNRGEAPLLISNVMLDGDESGHFDILKKDPGGNAMLTNIPKNGTTAFGVRFDPLNYADAGKMADLHITSNDSVTPTFVVHASGTAAAPYMNISISADAMYVIQELGDCEIYWQFSVYSSEESPTWGDWPFIIPTNHFIGFRCRSGRLRFGEDLHVGQEYLAAGLTTAYGCGMGTAVPTPTMGSVAFSQIPKTFNKGIYLDVYINDRDDGADEDYAGLDDSMTYRDTCDYVSIECSAAKLSFIYDPADNKLKCGYNNSGKYVVSGYNDAYSPWEKYIDNSSPSQPVYFYFYRSGEGRAVVKFTVTVTDYLY